MATQLGQINAFCSRRYNTLHNAHCGLARAYTVIMDRAHNMRLNRADPERDLLDWLSRPHTDSDLARACQEVLEHIGASGWQAAPRHKPRK